MGPSQEIERICLEQGGERAERIAVLEAAILAAAKKAWGQERRLEAQFDEAQDTVLVYQAVEVVERVEPSRQTVEIDLATASELGSELGDELLVQIFYRDEDAASAAHRDQFSALRPPLDVLAAGLPFEGPEWMRPIWPHRQYAGLFMPLPPRLPFASVEQALDALQSSLRSARANIRIGPASAEELAEAGQLGPFAKDVVALYQRFGAPTAGDPLMIRELPLQSVRDARSLSERLGRLESRLADLVPLFASSEEEGYLLDLTDGRVLHWYLDEGDLSLHAPSFQAWMGFLAEGTRRGLLRWEPGRGLVEAGESSAASHVIAESIFRLKQPRSLRDARDIGRSQGACRREHGSAGAALKRA